MIQLSNNSRCEAREPWYLKGYWHEFNMSDPSFPPLFYTAPNHNTTYSPCGIENDATDCGCSQGIGPNYLSHGVQLLKNTSTLLDATYLSIPEPHLSTLLYILNHTRPCIDNSMYNVIDEDTSCSSLPQETCEHSVYDVVHEKISAACKWRENKCIKDKLNVNCLYGSGTK